MNRILLAAALALTLAVPATRSAAAEKPPNILFLLTDDQRNDTLGCAGHPILKTPNIDALAAGGVRFENAFVTTSICAASRASIFSGLHERTHRYTFREKPMLAAHTDASYPALLAKAGYATGFIGKFGVNVQKGAREKMFNTLFKSIGRNPYLKPQPGGGTRHETELAGDAAEEFIGGQTAERPFCLSISFNASHAEDGDKRPGIGHFPWPAAVDGLYDDVDVPAPRLGDPAIFESQPKFMRESMNRDRWYWRWDTPEKYQTNIRAYFRMISGIDGVVGRLRNKLEASGLAGNTVIIYTGDNGYYMGDRGFAGKWSHYEQSLRVPMIILDPRAPEGQHGQVRPELALNIDLAATMLDLAGVDIPPHYQGRSLRPLMRGEAVADWRRDFFCEHLMRHADIPKWQGVRGTDYVYASYFGQEPAFEFLHHLPSDPDQLRNLATDPAHAKALAEMRKRCETLAATYAAARPGE